MNTTENSTSSNTTSTNQNNTHFGAIIAAMLIIGLLLIIGYMILRSIKKRNLDKKDIIPDVTDKNKKSQVNLQRVHRYYDFATATILDADLSSLTEAEIMELVNVDSISNRHVSRSKNKS